MAPVKAPRSCPKSSLSRRPAGMAAQFTFTRLRRKSNPSSFLVRVKQNSSAFCRDPAQGLVKLCAAIATRRPKNIASETLRAHTLEDVPPISELAAHQGDVRLLVDLILECVKTELAVFRRQTRGCAFSGLDAHTVCCFKSRAVLQDHQRNF